MKIADKDAEKFVAQPQKELRAVLIFGADEGMVRTRRDTLLSSLNIERSDPFSCTELSADTIEKEPSLLFEALQSMSLTGQAPCVILSNAGHALTDTIKTALTTPACSNLLLLTAGDLAKGSLRTLFEDARRKECAVLACYRQEGADLASFIRQFLLAQRIIFDRPTLELLTSLLGNDRAITQSELEKIDLYLGEDRTLTQEMVLHLLSNNQYNALGDAAMSWLVGDISRFLGLCDRLFKEGEHPVAFVRILMATANRLLGLQQQVAEGISIQQAMAAARPPIFYKEAPRFQLALKRFSGGQLVQLISNMNQMEATLKRTTIPEMVLIQDLITYNTL